MRAHTTDEVILRPRRKGLFGRIRSHWVAYTYIAPFYILFAVFGAFPIAFSLFLSFNEWNGLDPIRFAAFRNYARLFGDPIFWQSVYNTLFIGIIAHIPMLLFALVLAFVLNSGLVRFKEGFRTMFFLPVITSSVAVSIVFLTLFGYRAGLINYVLSWFGFSAIDWWGGQGQFVKPAIIILFVWRWVGWNMVMYLAGLQAIPGELSEAATIDGASVVQVFWRVILPLLRPIVLFTLILSTVGTFTLFDEPFVLVGIGGGSNRAGLTMMVYLYREAFRFTRFGYSSSMAFVITVFIAGVATINSKLFGNKD